MPDFIPAGFVLEIEIIEDSFAISEYTKGTDYFSLEQWTLDAAMYVNTEGTTLEEFSIDGIVYYYYSNQGAQSLIWEYEEYFFTCTGTIDRELLIEIACSLKK